MVVVVVVVVGKPVVVVLVVVWVRVRLIGVPFLNPVTTAVESEPRNELKSPLILLVTLVCPWLAARVFICVAWLFKSVAVCATANAVFPIARPTDNTIVATFISLPPRN